jgi:hypothetical protein
MHVHVQRLASVVKMATVLEEYTTEEQSFVVHLFGEKGINVKVIRIETFPLYIGKCLSCKAVNNLFEKFSQGRSKGADIAWPSSLFETATDAIVQWVEELIPADRWITIATVQTALGCSHSLAYSIIHDRLKFRKVCARWVPREEIK